MTRLLPSFLLFSCLLAAGLLGAAPRQSPTRPQADSVEAPTTRNRPAVEALDREQLDKLVAVATDVSPEWGRMLRERVERDPDGAGRAILANGRRLFALSVLRDQDPDLYLMKVTELRLQAEMRELAQEYRSAMQSGRTEDAEETRRLLADKVREQVDLDLRARAQELAALDQHVQQLRVELSRDTIDRQVRMNELLDRLLQGREGADAGRTRPKRESDSTGAGAAPGRSKSSSSTSNDAPGR